MGRILLTAAARLAFVSCIVLIVAACSNGSSVKHRTDTARTRTTASGDQPPGRSIPAKLQIVMQNVGGKNAQGVPVPTALSCDKSLPATCMGSLTCPASASRDAARCEWVAAHEDLLVKHKDARSGGRFCTEQYGGPQRTHVTGNLRGTPVDVNFSRQDGCAISDWDHAQALWTD